MPIECVELEEDLQQIRCDGLLVKLWNIKDKNLVQELIVGVHKQYDLTVWAKPESWTVVKW